MKLYKNIKRTTMQYIIVSVICIIIIGGAALFTSVVLTNQIKEEYQVLLKEAYRDMESNKKMVYIAISDITPGDIVSKEKVEKKTVYSTQPQESYITNEDIGKVAVINITRGTHILKPMLTVNMVASGLREMEYRVVSLNTNIMNNDTVDLRIFFPNGEDYIILSKKIIKGMTPESQSCLLWLSEEEVLRMSSAIVDSYLYSGTIIYTSKYIEPTFQEASQVTYQPSVSTLLLIESNPNIVDTATNEISKLVRKTMENRLADSFHTNVQEIEWNLSTNKSVMEESAAKTETEASQDYFMEDKNTLNENATYQAEQRDKESDLDYGP